VVLLVWPSKSRVATRPAVPAAAAPPAPVAPPASTVRLEIVVSPSDATLVLDGKPLGANPYVGAYPRDTQVHELVMIASGYQPFSHQFALDHDLDLHLNLVHDASSQDSTPVSVSEPAEPRRAAARPAPQAYGKAVAAPIKPPPAKLDPPLPPPVTATSPKHTIDTEVYGKPANKRTLDSNVLDEDKAKPTIDRNPWEK
jgi:hypothetical protein